MEYIPTAGNLLSIFKDNGKVIEDEMLCGCQCTSYQLKNTEISTTFDIQEYFNEYHERVLLNSATVCIAFPEGENYSLCMDTEFVGGETNTKLSIKEMNFPCKTLGYDPDTGLLKIGPLWFDTNLKKMVKDLRFSDSEFIDSKRQFILFNIEGESFMAVNGDNYVDRAPSSFGVYDVIHEKDITPYRDVLYADEIVSTSAFKTKGDAINFLVEKSLVSQEELTENAFVQTLSQKDKSILANLFDDKTRLTLIKTGRVSLYGIQLRCRMEFDSKPIPSIPINCDLAIKSVSGKFELCLIPKDGVTPIGPLNKYVDDGGGVLVQAIKADLIKASRKTHEQNKNIAENIIKHKK